MINIAELLKYAPKGMKLYSPLFGEVEFIKINSVNAVEVIVTCTDGTQGIERFHSNGTYISRCPNAECLLFPSKDCRTWEGWKLPLKAGDVVMFVVNNKLYLIGNNGKTFDVTGKENKSICGSCKRVTLEEEQNFFAQLCLNGYTWDADKKELRKTIKPKFKVGDWIASIDDEGDMATEKIVSFSHNKVLLVDTDGCHTEYPKTELSNFHLWSIADAKDGDVLATDNGWTCIFKAFDGCMFSSYCFMDSQKWFCEVGSEAHTLDSRINGNIHPANKEQCNQFFTKMKEDRTFRKDEVCVRIK